MQMWRRKESEPETLRLLVVEDDPIFQEMLRQWLDDGKTSVARICGSLQEARVASSEERFDLVLLDLNLPDSRGVSTVKRLQDTVRTTPIVVLTSEEDSDKGVQAVRQGAQNYLNKQAVDQEALQRELRFAHERRRVQELQATAMRHEIEAQRLRDMDRVKNRFYQAAARGLRDPLKPIQISLQMLRMEAQFTQEKGIKEAMQNLETHVEQLDQLIDDLVDIAGLQSGALEIERKTVDIGRVARDAVRRWEAMAKENRLGLDCMSDRDVLVEGDAERLGKVVDHLVQNAIKHTPGGGRVQVDVCRVDSDAEIRVRDTGVGIDPERIQRLFEAFRPTKDEEENPGLGLPYCKGIVDAHQGEITIRSAGDGEGTTVEVRLPILGRPDL